MFEENHSLWPDCSQYEEQTQKTESEIKKNVYISRGMVMNTHLYEKGRVKRNIK